MQSGNRYGFGEYLAMRPAVIYIDTCSRQKRRSRKTQPRPVLPHAEIIMAQVVVIRPPVFVSELSLEDLKTMMNETT
jgi:hypothetical protein